jgi:hypothetical protein
MLSQRWNLFCVCSASDEIRSTYTQHKFTCKKFVPCMLSVRWNRFLRCSVCNKIVSADAQRVSMFWLNQNKQKTNWNSLIGSIFCYFLQKILGFSGSFLFFQFFFVFFGLFQNSLFRLFRFYTKTETFNVSVELKQTEDPPKQFKREYIWVFFRKFWVVSVCFGLLQNSYVCFGCFDIGSKHRNKPKLFFVLFHETNAKQILFRFVSVRTKIYFCLFRGHPTATQQHFNKKYEKKLTIFPEPFLLYRWCRRQGDYNLSLQITLKIFVKKIWYGSNRFIRVTGETVP